MNESSILAKAKGRRCKICNKIGGTGSTTILKMLGYLIPDKEIGYAHSNCIQKVRRSIRMKCDG